MTKRILATAIAILVGLALVGADVGPASANGASARLGLGGRYARVHNNDLDESTNMGGAMMRVNGGLVALEGAVDYRSEDLIGGVDLKTWPVTASLLLYPLPGVYGIAGLGWYNTTIDFPSDAPFDDDTSTDLGYHFGAGVELPLAPRVGLTGDVRWHFVDYEFDDIPESIGKVDSDAYSVSVGAVFYLR